MKKSLLLILSLILIFGVFTTLPLSSEESDLYYVNLQIIKIFPHNLGYYIIYRRAGLKTGEAFIPKEWFDRRNLRAVLNYADETVTPYMTQVLKNGTFDHIRISVPTNIRNPVWGVLYSGTHYDDKFKVETLNLEY